MVTGELILNTDDKVFHSFKIPSTNLKRVYFTILQDSVGVCEYKYCSLFSVYLV